MFYTDDIGWKFPKRSFTRFSYFEYNVAQRPDGTFQTTEHVQEGEKLVYKDARDPLAYLFGPMAEDFNFIERVDAKEFTKSYFLGMEKYASLRAQVRKVTRELEDTDTEVAEFRQAWMDKHGK